MKRQLTKFLGVAVAMAMVIQVTSFGLEINSVHAFSLASEYEIVSVLTQSLKLIPTERLQKKSLV